MIEFKNVSKTYDNGTEALKNVNIKINDGEFVFIVGASGAGKSTFLKLMMREQVPNRGNVTINGFNLNELKKKQIPMFRRTLGIVFQDFRLIPTMTVFDNVAFAMRVIGAKEKEIRKRVPYILSLVGLSSKARSYPTQLSGGEQQRVALARALVNNAGLIIADEPTGNIDPEMSYEIVDLLNHINANGTTVVMVTHEHNLVRHFHHRVITIDQGSVVSDSIETDVMPEDYSKYEAEYPSEITEEERDSNKLSRAEKKAAEKELKAAKKEQKAAEKAASKEAKQIAQTQEVRKEKIREIVNEDVPINTDKESDFYIQPNSDKDLEKFIQNYGAEADDDTAEDDIDYSIYLDSLGDKNGGDR